MSEAKPSGHGRPERSGDEREARGRTGRPAHECGRDARTGTLPPFQDVLDRYGEDVYRVCVAAAGPAGADDCYQETMLAALAAYPSLRDPAAVRGWLLTIASRKAVDGFRASARTVPVADPDLGGRRDEEPRDEELWERVRALPPKQRLAVAHRFVLDLSYREIGAAMGTSEEAARRNVHEGLKRLRSVAAVP